MYDWIDVNMPWKATQSREFKRALKKGLLKELIVRGRKKFGKTPEESYAELKALNIKDYTELTTEQKKGLKAHRKFCRAFEEWYEQQPEAIVDREEYESLLAAEELRSFRNRLVVGMLFETNGGTRYLVGDVNKFGELGGCCVEELDEKTIIKRYKIIVIDDK